VFLEKALGQVADSRCFAGPPSLGRVAFGFDFKQKVVGDLARLVRWQVTFEFADGDSLGCRLPVLAAKVVLKDEYLSSCWSNFAAEAGEVRIPEKDGLPWVSSPGGARF